MIKEGNTTSEYKIEWMSTLIALATVIIPVVMEMLDKGHWAYVALAAVLAAVTKLGSMGYAASRAKVKSYDSMARAGAADPT